MGEGESGEGDDTDHPASTPRFFTEEEKAWGAILHSSRQWFSKHAMKEPPILMRDQACALELQPLANGLLFSDKRAGRLKALVELMPPGERVEYVRLAQERLARWQLTQTSTVEVDIPLVDVPEQQLSVPVPSETPPGPNALRPWRLPYDIVLPSLHLRKIHKSWHGYKRGFVRKQSNARRSFRTRS